MTDKVGQPPSRYESLRLRRNPFIAIPPIRTYEAQLRPLFSAREAEVARICRLAERAAALFVSAPYGGGKTVIVLEALTRLRQPDTVTVYAQFDRGKGFRQSLRDGMLASGLGVAAGDLLEEVRAAICQIRDGGRHVVLAIDDLDRASDIAEVFQVTHDVRDLLSDGASVIVTGQPFGVTYDLHTAAGGIFYEVVVPEFSADNFSEMLSRYLRAAHAQKGLPDTHPFHRDAAEFVCREIAQSKLTPRLFNFALSEILESAVMTGAGEITLDFALHHWATLAHRVVRSVTPLQARHLQIIFQAGQVSEDTPQVINELGQSELAEYPEVRELVLRPLLEQNLVRVRTEGGKEEYRLTPQTAAAVDELFSIVKRPPIPFEDLAIALD